MGRGSYEARHWGRAKIVRAGVGPVRGSLGQERLWQWQGVAKAEG